MATNGTTFEAPTPAEMTVRAEQGGIKKAGLNIANMFVLALLAGMLIGFGAIFSTTVVAGTANVLPYGLVRLLAGISFSFCLVMVVVTGAELFTGNTLMVVALANRRISAGNMLKNWIVVYLGNLIGSLALAALVFAGGQYAMGNGAAVPTALTTASTKVALGFGQAIALGILANILVCMAVWMCFGARTTTDRVLSIMPPIAAFVAAGFEHSIANMYFIPVGLLIKAGAPASFWQAIGKTPADYAGLTWSGFAINNLLPVTLGNIIGGSLVVGLAYWFAFLRPRAVQVAPAPQESGLIPQSRTA